MPKLADSLSKEKRSWNMSQIHGKDTSIEVKVRKYLFHSGFRYHKNYSKLPGKPDIVLPKYRCVVFIHGCFWHRHPGCKDATTPKTRTDFWSAKFSANVANDKKHYDELSQLGWRVITLWECDINKHFSETMNNLIEAITKEPDT